MSQKRFHRALLWGKNVGYLEVLDNSSWNLYSEKQLVLPSQYGYLYSLMSRSDVAE